MNPQLEGIAAIAGTYPFDVARSVERFRINRFFWSMATPVHREAFVRDEAAACRAAGLTDEETALVRNRDWLGLIKYGVMTNLDVYASMRGESLEDFLKTRRVPNAR